MPREGGEADAEAMPLDDDGAEVKAAASQAPGVNNLNLKLSSG